MIMYIPTLICLQGPNGVEYLTIPLDGSTLTEFLEQQEDEAN